MIGISDFWFDESQILLLLYIYTDKNVSVGKDI